MADIQILLGPVAFRGFEVPECLRFGGEQRVVVHHMPGGNRVIDVLGRDEAELTWAGSFAGIDAADRARMLDALRVEGSPLLLCWDSFAYTVIIKKFEAEYQSPWWIPYNIACTVLRDEAGSPANLELSLTASVIDDLAAAASYTDVSSATAAMVSANVSTAGTASWMTALGALATTRSGIEAVLTEASVALQSSDFPTALAASGSLAQVAAARGYVARGTYNLAGASA